VKLSTEHQYSAFLFRIRVNLGLGSYLGLKPGYPG